MTVPKDDKLKDYARYAEHCLNMVASTGDRELRRIQREMAAEWMRLADEIRRPRKSWQIRPLTVALGAALFNSSGAGRDLSPLFAAARLPGSD
jgi:hypothetical protein